MRIQFARPVVLNHVISPYGISLISTLLFLAAWALPVQLYSSLVNEPDLMYLDAETLLFFLLCVVGFWVGLLLIDFLMPTPALNQVAATSLCLRGLRLLIPLIITTVMTVFAGLLLLKTSPNLLVLLFAQQGATIKYQSAEAKLGLLGWGVAMQTVILWWTYWRLSNFKPQHGRRVLSWLIFTIGIIAQVAISILRVSRSEVIPVFVGLAILYLMGRIVRGELKTSSLLRYLVLFPMAAMLLFVLFGLLRGISDITVALGDFAGYTIASYNRMAAVIHGSMRYPYAGHGIYLVGFLTSNNLMSTVIPLKDILGWPDFFTLWNSEFQAPQLAGLNSYLIWSGAFGYIFSEVGWAAPLILVCIGLIYGIVWREARLRTTIGISLYPWFAFCGLSWFTANLVFDSRLPFFVVAGLLLMLYEKLLAIN